MKNKTGSYKLLVTASVVFSFILIGYPILIIVLKSLSGGLSNYINVFTDPKNLVALKNSLFLAIVGTLGSTLIGCFLAWLVSRTKVWFPGIIEGLLGLFAKYWRGIIAPIVSTCVVTAIGFSLLSVGANSFAGGAGAADFGSAQNWVLGIITLVACILFNILAKGHLKQLSVLFGLVVGYIVALCMGKVDLSSLEGVALVSLPRIMPYKPVFNINAIISVVMIFLVSATETIGDTSAMTNTVLGREASESEISGSLACDGLISSLSACFGCMPITSFSQNVGLLAMTKVVNRYTIATGAGILLLAGIFPAFGAVLATLPEAVLGGCTIMMFGNIVISGLQMIGDCGFTQRNITIAALSLSIGLGFTQVPEMFNIFPTMIRTIFAENCVAVVFLAAIIMNLIMPKESNH